MSQHHEPSPAVEAAHKAAIKDVADRNEKAQKIARAKREVKYQAKLAARRAMDRA